MDVCDIEDEIGEHSKTSFLLYIFLRWELIGETSPININH